MLAGTTQRFLTHKVTVSRSAKQWLCAVDVMFLPILAMWFIWEPQPTAQWTHIAFGAWVIPSLLLHSDNAKTLGWHRERLLPAIRQAAVGFGLMAAALVLVGIALGAWQYASPISFRRVAIYAGLCVLQQVALNSLLHNRMLVLVRNEWSAAGLTGAVFAICHWPNPVLVPLTFIGGTAMAWMFGRVRSVIPLATGQALLGILVALVFPAAWHHGMRIGPAYYKWRQ
jgi:Type II CAAX prenyl endopeptidase Rce1-like